jgi:hypothetical protein
VPTVPAQRSTVHSSVACCAVSSLPQVTKAKPDESAHSTCTAQRRAVQVGQWELGAGQETVAVRCSPAQ